jgi:hypothetical protein
MNITINIMMVKSKVNTVKLIDLGIAVRKGSNNLYKGKHYRKQDTIFCPPEQRLSEWWILDDIVIRFPILMRQLQLLFRQYVGISPKWIIQRYREKISILVSPVLNDANRTASTQNGN